MEQTSEEPVGMTGAIGKIADLVISLKGLVAALTVLGGLLGLYAAGDRSSTPGTGSQATLGPGAPGPAPAPESTASDGWAIVGHYVKGELTRRLITCADDLPVVGETCEVLGDLELCLQNPEERGESGKIVLREVRKGERIEVLGLWRKDEKGAPLWVKLRVVPR